MLTRRRISWQRKLPEIFRKVFSQFFTGSFFGRLLAGDPAAVRLRGALRGGIAVSREARSNSLSSAVEIERAPCSGADRGGGRRFHDVQINHRRGDAGVPHQLLDLADVDALLEEMGGKPNGVAVRQTERSEAHRVRES